MGFTWTLKRGMSGDDILSKGKTVPATPAKEGHKGGRKEKTDATPKANATWKIVAKNDMIHIGLTGAWRSWKFGN